MTEAGGYIPGRPSTTLPPGPIGISTEEPEGEDAAEPTVADQTEAEDKEDGPTVEGEMRYSVMMGK